MLLLPDSPTRVGPPDYDQGSRGFGELPIREQLHIAEGICRRRPYSEALLEALPESDRYAQLLGMLLEPDVPDAEIVKFAREMVLDYLQAVAVARGDDLVEFAP